MPICQRTTGLLTRLGYEVVLATNGVEAWEVFQESPIPLVLTDWMMPEMSGLELIQRIRVREGERIGKSDRIADQRPKGGGRHRSCRRRLWNRQGPSAPHLRTFFYDPTCGRRGRLGAGGLLRHHSRSRGDNQRRE